MKCAGLAEHFFREHIPAVHIQFINNITQKDLVLGSTSVSLGCTKFYAQLFPVELTTCRRQCLAIETCSENWNYLLLFKLVGVSRGDRLSLLFVSLIKPVGMEMLLGLSLFCGNFVVVVDREEKKLQCSPLY